MTDQSKLIARLKQQPRHGSAIDDFNEALKQTFALYQEGAGDVMRDNVFKVLSKNIQDAYNEVNVLEKRNRSLSDALKVSTKRAAELGFAFDQQGEKLSINSAKLKQYVGDLNKLIPGQTRFLSNQTGLGAKIAKQLDDMRNKLGLTDTQYEQLLKNQTLFAGSNEKVSDGMDKFAKILEQAAVEAGTTFEGVQATIAETVASMDSEAAARFGRMSKENFVKAALAAKKLGVEMNTLLGIGDSFLDVESAIATELELQLLGAKDLNVAAIQKAALAGDALELEQQLENFIRANGEQLKENPILLEKSAAAFQMQKSQLLDMYAQLKLNNEAAEYAGTISAETAKTNTNIQTEEQKLQDKASLDETKALLEKYNNITKIAQDGSVQVQKGIDSFVNQVTNMATIADKAQTEALKNAGAIANTLGDSSFVTALQGGVKLYNRVNKLIELLKPGSTETSDGASIGQVNTAAPTGNDLFIPAGGANTVISGPFGAFTMNPGDDILAAPGIREAGGGGASAVIAALSKMSFHVTNVFDGDKIKSSLEIRQGQTLNNINNIA
jgi:hypothetical protein